MPRSASPPLLPLAPSSSVDFDFPSASSASSSWCSWAVSLLLLCYSVSLTCYVLYHSATTSAQPSTLPAIFSLSPFVSTSHSTSSANCSSFTFPFSNPSTPSTPSSPSFPSSSPSSRPAPSYTALPCYPDVWNLTVDELPYIASLYSWEMEREANSTEEWDGSRDADDYRVTIQLSGVHALDDATIEGKHNSQHANASTSASRPSPPREACPLRIPTAYMRVSWFGWSDTDGTLQYRGMSEQPLTLDHHSPTRPAVGGDGRRHFTVARVRLWCPHAEWAEVRWTVQVHVSFITGIPIRNLLRRDLNEWGPEFDAIQGELVEHPVPPESRAVRQLRPPGAAASAQPTLLCGSPEHAEAMTLDALLTYPSLVPPSPIAPYSLPASTLLPGVAQINYSAAAVYNFGAVQSEMQYHPFGCRIDRSVVVDDELRRLRWVQLMGDSNMRQVFNNVCHMGFGERHWMDTQIHLPNGVEGTNFYNPQLCIGPLVTDDGDPSDTTPHPAWIITYVGWMQYNWNTGVESLDEHNRYNFISECEQFVRWRVADELEQKNKTIFRIFRGWPDCDNVTQHSTSALYRDLLRMDGPGASFVSWGSHQPGTGVTQANFDRLMTSDNYGASYFYRFPAIMVGTTDSWSAAIPRKFGRQFIVRNDERISAQNGMVAYAIARLLQSNSTYGGCQLPEVHGGCWFPYYDILRLTASIAFQMHSDAQHYTDEVYVELVRHMLHAFHNAPQFVTQRTTSASQTAPSSTTTT